METEFLERGPVGSVVVGYDIARRFSAIDPSRADVPRMPLYLNRGLRAFQQHMAANDVQGAEAALTRAKALVDGFAPVFSHGDLNTTNFDDDGCVWDWDNAGLRPYGYDAAFCCRERGYDGGEDLLAFSAQAVEREGRAREDRLAFVFFTLCFWHAAPLQRGKKGFASAIYQTLLMCLKGLDASPL
ncbi:MAG: aminoglycoside phosphotransferase family protein [Cypionkella sp.]|nr:aminoglycoside phosphotransferase family protein [Cypionkella sp.]